MKRVYIISIFFSLFIIGCATQVPMYYWGNYSSSLYKYKKQPIEENLRAHKVCLINIIDESNKREKKIPPGICCEYGYILLMEGNPRQALYYFEMEEKNYPESKVFIDRLRKFIAPDSKAKPALTEELPTFKQTAPHSNGNTVTVTWTFATIRSGSGNNFPVVTTVKQGDRLTIIGEYTDWFNVRLENGQQGWISNRAVK